MVSGSMLFPSLAVRWTMFFQHPHSSGLPRNSRKNCWASSVAKIQTSSPFCLTWMTRWERSGFRKCITSTHVLLLSAITRWNDIIFRENLLKLEVYFKTLNFEVVKTEAAITVKTETRWQRTTILILKCYERVRRCFRSSPTSEVSSGCGWVGPWWPCSSRSSSWSLSSF